MATGVIRQSNQRFDNLFFAGMVALFATIVFVGFARSYYMAGLFKTPLPNLLVQIHGAVFSAWFLLLITQTSLVAAGRVDLHRRIGLLAATDLLGRMIATGGSGMEFRAKAFYAIPLADMLVFSTLIYFAFRNRSNPAAHKRLILIATIALLVTAFSRFPIPVALSDHRIAQMCCYPLLSLLMGYDLWSTGKVHRATVWASVSCSWCSKFAFPSGELLSGKASPHGC